MEYENDVIIAEEDARLIDNFEIQTVRTKTNTAKVRLYELEKGFDEADAESDADDEELPGQNLSLGLSWLGLFLNLTGCFTKKQLRSDYGCALRFIQAVAVSLVVTYHLFQFGVGKLSSKHIRPVVVADNGFPFTFTHDVLWQVKWSVAYVLGMAYFGSGHLDSFLSGIRLSRPVYKKAKRHWYLYLGLIATLVLVIPAVLHPLRLYDLRDKEKNANTYTSIIICDLVYLIFRVATVPSFCVVTAVLYLVKVSIDMLGRTLKCLNAGLGVPYAEREIWDCKKKIRKADTRLKWYLICHMVLILMTAFTGLFSCIERMKFQMESNNNSSKTAVQLSLIGDGTNKKATVIEVVQLRRRMQELHQKRAAIEEADNDGGHFETLSQVEQLRALVRHNDELQRINERLMNITLTHLLNAQKAPSAKMLTVTSSNSGPSHLHFRYYEKGAGRLRVFLETIVGFLEVIVLFLIPLTLLAWHNRAILRVADEIADIDIEDQRRLNLLIDNKNTKHDIVSELKSMRGVTVFGLQVSLYKGAFVTMLAPFITIVLHVMFNSYGLK